MSVRSAPPRPEQLRRWLERTGRHPMVVALPGDVSLRRYFRVSSEERGSEILAWYPKALDDRFEAFETTTALLEGIGVRVPRILAKNRRSGLMLLEDCGDTSVADLPFASAEVEPLYHRALDYAARIGALDAGEVPPVNPPLDEAYLRRELDQTWSAFLERELADDTQLRNRLGTALDAICSVLGRHRLVPCHRDLMARNLLVPRGAGGERELVVIDHQDLRLGPPYYDLASLLHDSTRLSADQIRRLEDELVPPGERATYARVSTQRLFKILGTFHAFAARGHARHLALVPQTLLAATRQLGNVPEGAEVAEELARRWGSVGAIPRVAGQAS